MVEAPPPDIDSLHRPNGETGDYTRPILLTGPGFFPDLPKPIFLFSVCPSFTRHNSVRAMPVFPPIIAGWVTLATCVLATRQSPSLRHVLNYFEKSTPT